MTMFVRGRFTAHPGKEADFEKIARTLADRAGNEPGTLTYRWFTAGEGTYLVLEEYTDEAAAMAHNEASADLISRVPDHAELVEAEIYGPTTLAWAENNPRVTIHPDLSS